MTPEKVVLVLSKPVEKIAAVVHLAGSVHEVHLGGDGGLDRQVGGIWRRADGEPLIGERAAIVEQPVDPGAEAAGIGDVQGAVEGEIAADIEQRGAARCPERHVGPKSWAAQRQAAHCQRLALYALQRAGNRDIAADDAAAAKRRPVLNGDGTGAERPTDQQGAGVDSGLAVETGAVAVEREGACADLGEATLPG